MFKFVCISGILGDVSFCDGKDVISIPFEAISHNEFYVYPDQQYTREELEKLIEKLLSHKKELAFKRELHTVESKLREKIGDMCSLTLKAFDNEDAPFEKESIPQLVDIDAAKKLIEEAADWYK